MSLHGPAAIRHLLELEPVPGVTFQTGMAATREQLARVHTLSYVDSLSRLRGKSAWLDVDTTAVSPGAGRGRRADGSGEAVTDPPGRHFTSTLRRLACFSLGRVSSRMPFLKLASALSASMSLGSATVRLKEPLEISERKNSPCSSFFS